MDWVTCKENGLQHLEKYKYVLLILLVGLFLMALPEEKQTPPEAPPAESVQPDLQESLGRILSRVEGAGKVEVLLTESAGARNIYQTNRDTSQSDSDQEIRTDTVLITNAGREETGLIRQVIPPTYQGAVVLCQGADSARVRLAVVNAVASVTGLRSDQITVLKMK